MDEGFCNKKIHDKIATCDYNTYESIFSIFSGQTKLFESLPTYSVYKVDVIKQKGEHFIDLQCTPSNTYHITFRSDDDCIFLNCLSTKSTNMYLSINEQNKRYVFFPFVFSTEVCNVGHFSFLVYLMDPNGCSSYFHDIMIKTAKQSKLYTEEELELLCEQMLINSEELIEELMETYINKLNMDFNLNYKFISRKTWNPHRLSVNKSFKNCELEGGNCVITATLIMYYLLNTKSDIIEPYQLLNNISHNELIMVINNCSVGFHNIITTNASV